MDPERDRYLRLTPWLPRLRGDGPRNRAGVMGVPLAPPPTRGWTRHGECRSRPPRGSPAYAGMDPALLGIGFCFHRLPRLRGDGPLAAYIRVKNFKAPPPTRGWTPTATASHGTMKPKSSKLEPAQRKISDSENSDVATPLSKTDISTVLNLLSVLNRRTVSEPDCSIRTCPAALNATVPIKEN